MGEWVKNARAITTAEIAPGASGGHPAKGRQSPVRRGVAGRPSGGVGDYNFNFGNKN